VLWKIWFVNRYQRISTLIYLALGWFGAIASVPLADQLPVPGLVWLVLGGVSYSVGTIFFLWQRLPYHNVVWHGFVSAGVACHYVAILGYVLTAGS
jgi:hemolysin III